jgi:hypothetical protein
MLVPGPIFEQHFAGDEAKPEMVVQGFIDHARHRTAPSVNGSPGKAAPGILTGHGTICW